MTLLMRDKENIEKGRLEGLAEGKAEGLAEGLAKGKAEGLAEAKKQLAKMLLQKGTFSDLDIADMIEISLEELLEIKDSK